MKAEQKWKSGQGKLQKKVKKSVGLGICVFLTLLLVSQLHYEKRIQKFVLRNEEELTEFTKTTWQWNKGKDDICLKSGKRKMVTAYS